jgi:ABC-type phosphate transport system substrate-binding protein
VTAFPRALFRRALFRQALFRRSLLPRVAGAIAIAAVALIGLPAAASAGGYVTINGSGSSWSAVAIDQWTQDVQSNGITVNYSPDGSAAGRADYIHGQDDFAASDPPFRNGSDKLAGTGTEVSPYGYSYVPDTAGGTAFMYHLVVAGHLVTNLRLSGETIMKIFTGQITNWDDSEITHDYGAQLPNVPITPVVRSDGSGATYFFTRWMAHMFPNQWNAFCEKVTTGRVKPPCGQTEFYPTSNWGNVKAENGSNNVATYITSSYANGAIGYDEYAYALNSHYPVVKMLNPAGYYVLPTASNVAVALTQAQINEDPSSINFLQQNLDSVYTYTDPRSYPLSSYSYLIVPRSGTKQPPNFSTGKGATLSTFINFLLCSGQQQMAALGYSPLPLNLVKGGLLQVDSIPGHVPTPNPVTLAGCDNPTFTDGQLTLLKDAPQPSPCDKVGEPLDCVVVDGHATKPGAAGSKPGKAAGSTPGTGGSASPGAVSPSTAASGSAAVPVTGQVVNVADTGANRPLLSVLTAVAIVIAIATPPALGLWLRRRRGRAPG